MTDLDLFLTGAATAALTAVLTGPIERLRLIQQQRSYLVRTGRVPGHYPTSLFGCLRAAIAREGVLSLWRGTFVKILRCFPKQGLALALRGLGEASFGRSQFPVLAPVVQRVLVTAIPLAILYPLDYAHTQLACDVPDAGSYQFQGIRDVVGVTSSKAGLSGLFRGFGLAALGKFVYRASYFGLYHLLLQRVFGPLGKEAWPARVLARVVSGLLAYPLDTLRRRLVLGVTDCERSGQGTLEVARQMIAEEGVGSLFGGLLPAVLRAVPTIAVMALVDQIKQ